MIESLRSIGVWARKAIAEEVRICHFLDFQIFVCV
jgi:hypothetical protein